jgi:predicted transcriptional regulator
MARLTITLPDELHQALKEAAAKRRRSLGGLVAESLEAYGIKTEEQARDLVAKARKSAGLSEERALEVATDETRAARGQ